MSLSDAECVSLLQWACPRLGLRWDGFRRVRGQVCKRIGRRMAALGLSAAAYRERLEREPSEWRELEAACRVTISRFYRDRAVWGALRTRWLPGLVAKAEREGRPLRCWSAGACSGEEPYTLALVLEHLPAPRFEILATEVDPGLLERARRGCYPRGSLRELPAGWTDAAFRAQGRELCIADEVRARVRFEQQDLRRVLPDGPFDLILCRNVVFTYFAPEVQRELAPRLFERLAPGGVIAIGTHETPQADFSSLSSFAPLPIFQRRQDPRPI